MRSKIRCDGKYEKFCKIFCKLNWAFITLVTLLPQDTLTHPAEPLGPWLFGANVESWANVHQDALGSPPCAYTPTMNNHVSKIHPAHVRFQILPANCNACYLFVLEDY
jgi:hypothetical protein